MRKCTRCLYPDTKPDLHFDQEGICSACRSFEARQSCNWTQRIDEFEKIMERYRSKDGGNYDCIIPVSGGKDSTYQVWRIKQMGYRPLCVTATTDSLSDVGRRNLNNIRSLGVDCVEVSVNPRVRRKLNGVCLETIGDISWPEHVAIFTIPVRIAVQMHIPLIICGENPQNEYGGQATASHNP